MYQLIGPRSHGEVFVICEVCVVIDAAALEVVHYVIPGEGHGVLVVADSVVVPQGVRQEFLGLLVNVGLLEYNSQDNNCNLKRKMESNRKIIGFDQWFYLQAEDDNDEDSVCCEQDSRLLDGAAVSKEAKDEDKGPERHEDVGGIVNQHRINEILQLISIKRFQ